MVLLGVHEELHHVASLVVVGEGLKEGLTGDDKEKDDPVLNLVLEEEHNRLHLVVCQERREGGTSVVAHQKSLVDSPTRAPLRKGALQVWVPWRSISRFLI